jgi:hypothetical protein
VLFDAANSMKKNSEHLHFGVSGFRSEQINLMWEQFSVIVNKKQAKSRVIVADVSNESVAMLKKMKKSYFKNFNFRFLKGFDLAPIIIIDNKTYIINWENPSIIVITSKTIAKQFVSFFESLWKISK